MEHVFFPDVHDWQTDRRPDACLRLKIRLDSPICCDFKTNVSKRHDVYLTELTKLRSVTSMMESRVKLVLSWE